MSNNNQNNQCEMLKRIENNHLRGSEIGMLHYNGIFDNETLESVVNGLYSTIMHDAVILKASDAIRVVKTEHGVNIYSKPCPATVFGFKSAPNCDVASIIAKRMGSLFPNYTTQATKNGAFTQHILSNRKYDIPLKYRYLTMVSPALLIKEGFGGTYRKQKTKSKVLETYKRLD